MMLLTLVLKGLIALAVLVAGFVLGLLILGKDADEAIGRALDEYVEHRKLEERSKNNAIQTCTRSEPHVCQENGPCNGWPKSKEKQ
jgi:hypothetical protein